MSEYHRPRGRRPPVNGDTNPYQTPGVSVACGYRLILILDSGERDTEFRV